MGVKETLQGQMAELHRILEAAVCDCPPEAVAKRLPGAKINSIGAIYAHTVFGEDGILNALIRRQPPVYFAGGWADKIAIEMPRGGMEPDWSVTMDLDLFRQYAAAVYQATDDYIAGLTDDELERVVDLGFAPPMPVCSAIANVLAWHAATHQGEISALKGVQGLEGLVMTH